MKLIIISSMEKLVIISIADTNSFIYLSFRKYSIITGFHVFWADNLNCVLILSLVNRTDIDLVSEKYDSVLASYEEQELWID